jgi:branched-chain amino acid transport system permease protein
MELSTFFQQLANALSLGSLYALIAIGYTMVYGILRLINFAHGDVFMLGAYFAFYAITLLAMPWWIAFAVALGLTAVFGMGLERAGLPPLSRDSPKISVMISAIGASFLIQNLGVVIFGGRPKSFPSIPSSTPSCVSARFRYCR